MFLFKLKSKKSLSIFLIIVISFINQFIIDNNLVLAAEPFVTIIGGSTGSQETVVKNGEIIQTGRHNSADDDAIRYRTLFYRMTTDKYNLNRNFSEGDNSDIHYASVPMDQKLISDTGTIKIVDYVIKQKDFMSAAAKIGITGDYIVQHGNATVYLNNVFMIFRGDNTLYSSVYGYQEMLSKAPWSAATINYLKGYYNFEYVISNSTVFKVKVIAVDTDGNILNNDLLGYTKNAIYNEKIPPYTLQNDKIVANGKTYEYQYWKYTYKDRESEDIKSLGNFTGKSVSFNAPDTYPGSTLTVKMVFKNKAVPSTTPTPTPVLSGTPAPTPTPKPSVTPKPTIPPVATPVPSAPISLPIDSPDPSGVINGDKYGSPYFTSEKGISTTESQYVYVKTKDYLLGYRLENRTGKRDFYVPVTMNYTLEYFSATPPKAGGPKMITEIVSDIQIIKVERAYSYWEITNLEYYTVNNAVINNYSLPDGRVLLSANNTYLNIPTLSTSHSSDINSHVQPPSQVSSGITLVSPHIYSSATSDRPIIDYENLTYYAQTMTDEAQVKNDYLKFGSTVVLSDSASSKLAPAPNVSSLAHTSTIIQDKALYTDKKVIDALKLNGVYPSTGTVTYNLHPSSVNASHSSKTYSVGVNNVTIHTPVICVPAVTADNKKWSQLIKPSEEAVQIVLDPDNTLNDFEVSISNTLKHSNRPGYLTRDFSRSFIDPEAVSYIARADGVVRNEVKLPFDVYQDTYNDNNKTNDKYIKAGTWFVLGRNTYRFYVPMWVQEGIYTSEFRSIAVNGADKLERTEVTRNADLDHYVATSTMKFEVSGRIYGLKIYDIYDYPKWENVFRVNKTMKFKLFEGAVDGTKKTSFNDQYAYYYPVGTKDQYGRDTGTLSRFTLPLINGSHPKYNNLGVLKTGYAVRFMLDTIGEMYGGASCIKIYPTFYYVDANGKNRKRVDLYYDEEINSKSYHLVKVGDGIDLVNLKRGSTGNVYSRIPEAELRNTAKVLNISYSKLYYKSNVMYAYSSFRVLNEFRTFVGSAYASEVAALPSFEKVKEYTGLNAIQISKYSQRWYGTYKLPTELHVVEAGYDVYGYLKKYGIDYDENFWLKNGYIIVNFNIVTVDKAGKEHLSYINGTNYMNSGYCSMSIMEGSIMSKKDNKGVEFTNKAGDLLYFYTDKSYNDDYEGRIY